MDFGFDIPNHGFGHGHHGIPNHGFGHGHPGIPNHGFGHGHPEIHIGEFGYGRRSGFQQQGGGFTDPYEGLSRFGHDGSGRPKVNQPKNPQKVDNGRIVPDETGFEGLLFCTFLLLVLLASSKGGFRSKSNENKLSFRESLDLACIVYQLHLGLFLYVALPLLTILLPLVIYKGNILKFFLEFSTGSEEEMLQFMENNWLRLLSFVLFFFLCFTAESAVEGCVIVAVTKVLKGEGKPTWTECCTKSISTLIGRGIIKFILVGLAGASPLFFVVVFCFGWVDHAVMLEQYENHWRPTSFISLNGWTGLALMMLSYFLPPMFRALGLAWRIATKGPLLVVGFCLLKLSLDGLEAMGIAGIYLRIVTVPFFTVFKTVVYYLHTNEACPCPAALNGSIEGIVLVHDNDITGKDECTPELVCELQPKSFKEKF